MKQKNWFKKHLKFIILTIIFILMLGSLYGVLYFLGIFEKKFDSTKDICLKTCDQKLDELWQIRLNTEGRDEKNNQEITDLHKNYLCYHKIEKYGWLSAKYFVGSSCYGWVPK